MRVSDRRQLPLALSLSSEFFICYVLSGHFKRMLSGRWSVFGCEVPGKQFVDPVDRVLGDSGQDLVKISFRVQTVGFGGAYQRVEGRSAYAARANHGQPSWYAHSNQGRFTETLAPVETEVTIQLTGNRLASEDMSARTGLPSTVKIGILP